MSLPLILAALLAPLTVILFFYSRRSKDIRHCAPLPPGPKKLPIIGNLLDMPGSDEWVQYRKWSRQYGSDLIHLDVAGTSIVVLNSWESVNDLIEKRSETYSSRPRSVMAYDLMGWDFHFAFMPYGERWRHHRKVFHQEFQPTAALRYRSRQVDATHALLRSLLDIPDEWAKHVRLMAGQIILGITYDIIPESDKDKYFSASEKALAGLNIAAVPGVFLVDALPFLKHIPTWFPGAGFQRKAQEWNRQRVEMIEAPYRDAKARIADGTAGHSYVSYQLSTLNPSEDNTEHELLVKNTAASMFSAGADTTVAVILSFVLAMLWYPDVLVKAQREIDAVLGKGHLPNFIDEDSLPYCSAVVKESFRWRPVTPVAVPHFVEQEDEYAGYRIPAGSIIIPNAWACLHDEKVYHKPSAFNPERFLKDGKLNPDVRDPTVACFGFGRRICPGRFMAISSVWIAITSIIATFDIKKAANEDGSIIEPSGAAYGGFVNATLPFKCTFDPRSEELASLIRATAA